VGHARGMYELMDLSDNDLLDILLNRKALPDTPLSQDAVKVLQMLRH
jgi:antitoxin CptB